MSRAIKWEGEPFALLIESENGDYLVPPIVVDEDGEQIEGREVKAEHEVMEAIVGSRGGLRLPIVRSPTASQLAEIDERMRHLSDTLGVPVGPHEG